MIAWNFSAVGTGIDYLMTYLFRQQVDPTIFYTVTVTEESSGIVTISIGISETQYPHRNHPEKEYIISLRVKLLS